MTKTVEVTELLLTEDLLAEAGDTLLIYKNKVIDVRAKLWPVARSPAMEITKENILLLIRKGPTTSLKLGDALGLARNASEKRVIISRIVLKLAKQGDISPVEDGRTRSKTYQINTKTCFLKNNSMALGQLEARKHGE